MTKVLVLYYSSYGHIEQMTYAVAEAPARRARAADVKRVPEIVPEATAKAAHFKLDQPAPIATVGELASYDVIVVGAPTRFGRMPSAMGSFWEQAGQLWLSGALVGKVGGAFSSKRHAARRQRGDALLDYRQSHAFRHGHHRPAL